MGRRIGLALRAGFREKSAGSVRLPSLLSVLLCVSTLFAADEPPGREESLSSVVPKASSEDTLIANYHSLGEIAGRTNIFRCANPVGDIANRLNGLEPTDADRQLAKARMQHLYDSGVRTVVSLQRQEPPTDTWKNPEYPAVTLEMAAAKEAGLTYVAYSMGNRGKDPLSLQYMPEDTVFQLMESITNDIVKRSGTGGVAFHCKSGKDRTGWLPLTCGSNIRTGPQTRLSPKCARTDTFGKAF